MQGGKGGASFIILNSSFLVLFHYPHIIPILLLYYHVLELGNPRIPPVKCSQNTEHYEYIGFTGIYMRIDRGYIGIMEKKMETIGII